MSREAAGTAGDGAARKPGTGMYRGGVGLGIASVLLLIWINGAVGIIGSENHPGNRMYLGVIGVAVVGAFIARLRPAGMAAAVVLVGAIAIIGGMGMPGSPPLELAGLTGIFAFLFAGSGLLFREAAGARERA